MTIEAYQALQDYFTHLSKKGYMRYDTVFKLLSFLFVEEMLHKYTLVSFSECDYNVIANFLDCIYGICLIPYPQYKDNIFVNTGELDGQLRITEDNIIRSTEDSSLRVTEPQTEFIR